MSHIFTIFSLLFLAASLVSLFVAFFAWQRRTVNGAAELARLMIAAGIWTFFVIFETAAIDVEGKVFWSKLAYFGAVSTPVLYLLFILRFTGNDKRMTVKTIILLFIVPLITLILAMSNEYHNLIWTGYSAIYSDTNIMEYYHGIWFWIGYLAYNYVLFGIATILLFRFIIRHSRTFKAQGVVLLIAGLFPWSASILYLTGNNPVPGLDLVPFTMILSGMLLVYAILYFRFLDLAPVARETLVETLTDGILALDGQNRIQDVNAAALSFLGIQNKSIIGNPVGSSGASVTELLYAAVSTEPVDQVEILQNGKTKTFRIIRQGIKNHPGSRLVVIRDITEQVARQKEIKEAELRYRNMFTMFRLMADNMPDMIWAKDLDKNFIFVNKSVCENLVQAIDTDEPIGKNDLFFAERERMKHPDRNDWYTFGELCRDSDQIVINSGKPEHFDEFGNVNGEFLFLDVRKSPILDDNGQMIGVVGSARDVTVQKQNEAEILRRDRLLDAIAKATARLVQGDNIDESINAALEIIGKATGVNRVYIFWNHEEPGYSMPLMSQSFEWTDGTVEPQIDAPELQNLPYEFYFPRWFRTLAKGNVISGNIREFPESEKEILEVQQIKSILVTPVFVSRNFWGFVGFDDCEKERKWSLTEERLLSAAANTIGAAFLRKKNQDELIAAKEKAEESDSLKSAFLANMSHEIRTPMNGILGFISLLQEPGLNGEEQEEYIDIVKRSGERLLNTIRDIVEISKIESGLMPVSFSEVYIPEIMRNLYSFFKREAESKGLRLVLSKDNWTRPDTITTDREKLNSILSNLLKNALKFTNEGTVEFGCLIRGDFIEFYVQDTGIGVPENRRQAIFERFVQADISHSRPYEGAGLGLSISKAFVEMLGGKIWLETMKGNGAKFSFQIPRAQKKEIHDESSSPLTLPDIRQIEKSGQKSMKILVSEDDEVNFHFINLLLKKEGHTVLHAATGTEAIKIFMNTPDIDLILMDIRLPDINGYDTTREIRKFNMDIPIVALTAFAFESDREKALEAGCNDYLSKPVKKEELFNAMRKFQ